MKKRVHFIGIGGIGMSALARIYHQKGFAVSGTDCKQSPLIDLLLQEGITIGTPLLDPDCTVVVSSAIAEDHSQVQQAKGQGARVIHRSDLLAELCLEEKSIAVAGTHGKTTTSSMLAQVLEKSGFSPSFCIGGIVRYWNSNARLCVGSPLVVEADESDATFVKYCSDLALVTNIDNDHIDFYGSLKNCKDAFAQFLQKAKKAWCYGDDPLLQELADCLGHQTVGFSEHCSVQISEGKKGSFSLLKKEEVLISDLTPPIPARSQMINTALVALAALELSADKRSIRQGLIEFSGALRRSEVLFEGDCVVIDDYAHHPVEIASTLEGIKKKWPDNRVLAIYQPHRYSRLQNCLQDLQSCFSLADQVWVTEVFSAGESPIKGLTKEKIASIIQKDAYPVSQGDIINNLDQLQESVVIAFLGAGDITLIAHQVANQAKQRCCL